jgi:acetyl-CoA carboxylase biotin carboxyl carrier protein
MQGKNTMDMTPDDIAVILEAIEKMDCAVVEVSVGDVRIEVRRRGAPEAPLAEPVPAPLASAGSVPRVAPAAAPAALAVDSVDTRELDRWLAAEAAGQALVIRAPMLGTFYRAKAPGEPSFVEVGGAVRKGATVALMEAMKLFHSLLADSDGTVAAIFADNGQMVEYDQPVLAIARAA